MPERAGKVNRLPVLLSAGMPRRSPSPFEQVAHERAQSPETRKPDLRRLERILDKPVMAYYTSFTYPVIMTPDDIQMMESVLQGMELSRGLALVISSPGGNPLAAEGIIRVCRSYSKTGSFIAIVPGQAKSAATMVCMGADQIIMGPASELGPVDPQVARVDNEQVKWFSAHSIVESYGSLFQEAVKTKGNIDPYLQQLQNYDAQEIEEFKKAIKLSEDIALRALQSGMMKGQAREAIKGRIKIFIEPDKRTLVHGRAIHREEAKECGLEIEYCDPESRSGLWRAVYALHVRAHSFVSRHASKCIETKDHGYYTPMPVYE